MSAPLGPADASVFDTFVVPRYLSWFADLAVEMVSPVDGARVAFPGCRTGYPSQRLGERLPNMTLVGVDPSRSAIEAARSKASSVPGRDIRYEVGNLTAPVLAAGTFTHVLALHPMIGAATRGAYLERMNELLMPGGQLILALPLRGSFAELMDLLREFALKHDALTLSDALERTLRPNVEALSEELEDAGFEDADVELRRMTLSFASGRAFSEDPITRLMVLAELGAQVNLEDLSKPAAYFREAIDKYWSEESFETTVHVGCAVATKS